MRRATSSGVHNPRPSIENSISQPFEIKVSCMTYKMKKQRTSQIPTNPHTTAELDFKNSENRNKTKTQKKKKNEQQLSFLVTTTLKTASRTSEANKHHQTTQVCLMKNTFQQRVSQGT
jgi:hypothetical protein